MAFVPDSRTSGYLGPQTGPLEDDAWVDFLHDLVAGITGLDTSLVRPRWTTEPTNMPDFNTTWGAVGIMNTAGDWDPVVVHIGSGDGVDQLRRQETVTVLCSFYGPRCQHFAGLLRDGLSIDQNRAVLRANRVGLREVGPFTRTPELIMNKWVDRIDVNLSIRREIRRVYNVMNIVEAQGVIEANPPGASEHIISTIWDTGPPP